MERCTGQPAGTPGPMRRGFADLPGRSIRRRAGAGRAPVSGEMAERGGCRLSSSHKIVSAEITAGGLRCVALTSMLSGFEKVGATGFEPVTSSTPSNAAENSLFSLNRVPHCILRGFRAIARGYNVYH